MMQLFSFIQQITQSKEKGAHPLPLPIPTLTRSCRNRMRPAKMKKKYIKSPNIERRTTTDDFLSSKK